MRSSNLHKGQQCVNYFPRNADGMELKLGFMLIKRLPEENVVSDLCFIIWKRKESEMDMVDWDVNYYIGVYLIRF